MTHPSKRKGNVFEWDLINLAKDAGLEAKRSYASDGRSLGLTTDVDCLIAGKKIQAKRRKKVAKWLVPEDTVDCVATRPDRGDTLIVMKYSTFLDMLSNRSS
jgi:Holliday junction resolvase